MSCGPIWLAINISDKNTGLRVYSLGLRSGSHWTLSSQVGTFFLKLACSLRWPAGHVKGYSTYKSTSAVKSHVAGREIRAQSKIGRANHYSLSIQINRVSNEHVEKKWESRVSEATEGNWVPTVWRWSLFRNMKFHHDCSPGPSES
jgi:hypothetical protein